MAFPDEDEGVDSNPDLTDLGGSSEDEPEEGADLGNKVDIDDDDDDDDGEEPARDNKGRFTKDKGGKGKSAKEDDEEEEKEDDEEEEKDDEEEEKEDDEDDKAAKGKKVPYARLQKVIRERNEANARNADLMNRLRAADPEVRRDERQTNTQLKDFDDKIKAVDTSLKADIAKVDEQLEGLYEQVEELRSESKTKEAAAVQRKIDSLKDRRVELREEALANKAALREEKSSIVNRIEARREAAVAAENAEYDRRIDILTSVAPQFDPDSEDFDIKAVKEFEFDVKAYEKAGMTPTQALTRAATLFLGYDPFDKKAAARAAKAGKDGVGKRGTDIRSNVDKSNKTPPKLRGRPEDGKDKLDISNMTEEQWSKLSEKEQRKYLGDAIK